MRPVAALPSGTVVAYVADMRVKVRHYRLLLVVLNLVLVIILAGYYGYCLRWRRVDFPTAHLLPLSRFRLIAPHSYDPRSLAVAGITEVLGQKLPRARSPAEELEDDEKPSTAEPEGGPYGDMLEYVGGILFRDAPWKTRVFLRVMTSARGGSRRSLHARGSERRGSRSSFFNQLYLVVGDRYTDEALGIDIKIEAADEVRVLYRLPEGPDKTYLLLRAGSERSRYFSPSQDGPRPRLR